MNERLLELAKQAGLKKEHGSDREYMGVFDWREFAELIVRECADIGDLYEGGEYQVRTQILAHFGVLE